MRDLLRPPSASPIARALRARGLLLPILLALAVAGLLTEGAVRHDVASSATSPAPASPPPASPAPFRPHLEKTPLAYVSDYWLQLARRTQVCLRAVGPDRIAGVVVRPGLALSSIEAADDLAVAGDDAGGRLLAADAREGIAVVALPAGTPAEPLVEAERLQPGEWLAAVTVEGKRGLQVTPGHLASDFPAGPGLVDVALPFPPTLRVAAVVDLDGHLIGVALRSREGVRVLSPVAAQALVERLAAGAPCRAVDVGPLPDAVRTALRLEAGAVVEAVWNEAFAAPPGLRPGDVLLEWGGRKISSPEDFRKAYDAQEPGGRVTFAASRAGGRTVGQAEMPGRDCRPAPRAPRELPLLGAVGQWSGEEDSRSHDVVEGLRLLSVPPGSPAERAGLEADDLILAVDGRRLVWPEARRLFDAAPRPPRPLILTVRRGDKVTLRAAPAPAE